jgi:hypothetical protein
MRFVTALSILVAMIAFASAAHAHSAGIDGFSSKTNGKTCNNCHSGGTAPTVAFSGPMSLAAGSKATYTFTVTTGATLTGLDVAATNGVSLAAGTNTQVRNSEITHTAGGVKTAGAGKVAYTFDVQAPATPPDAGSIQLWGDGLAANGNGANTGDRSKAGTMMITITPASTTMDSGTSGDAGTQPPADAGSTPGDDAGSGNATTPDPGSSSESSDEGGGCAVGSLGDANDVARGAGAAFVACVVCGALGRRRRARRRTRCSGSHPPV